MKSHAVALVTVASKSFARRRHLLSLAKVLYHPASRQEHEPAGGVRALDDLYGPFADFGEASLEFGTGIAAIGKHRPQPGI